MLVIDGDTAQLGYRRRRSRRARSVHFELREAPDDGFLDSGSARVKGQAVAILQVIADQLGNLPNKVAIEGHTDSVPYSAGQGPGYSNWELSVDRANSARRVLEAAGLRPHQVEAVRGFADTRLRMADKLPEPIFTPSTKAPKGHHDENVGFAEIAALIGDELAAQVRDTAIALYRHAAEHALSRGIIIADTKFEFGIDDEHGERLTLIDEAITPDSSRFWPVDTYAPGTSPPSFDKQFVRDYLETLDWDKTAPGPQLPAEVIRRTSEKYEEALRRLTA
jgi:hypothetical protein